MAGMLRERLPGKVFGLLKEFGKVADRLGFNAYLVGGLVRDVLLKRDNLDVDIVIEGDGISFAQAFAEHHDVRVRSHKKFGTAVVIFPDGFKVDVASARMEYYESPGAPPVVETSSLKMDLFRRDFTINTLAIKLNERHYGTLIDYFGAQKDIKDKVVRVLHNLSFIEDPTRVLRAIRFEQRFGFKIGKLTLALMKNAVKINCFKDLSGRRFFLEMKLILKEEDPIKEIERMEEFNLLQFLAPEIQLSDYSRALLGEIKKVTAWYNLLFLEEDFEPWKVYWHGITTPLEWRSLQALAERLGMADEESRRLISQRLEANNLMESLFHFEDGNYQLYTLLAPYDTETLLYVMARAHSEKVRRLLSRYFTQLKDTKILLTGKDLITLGFTPGPIFRRIFDRLLEARLNDRISSKEDEMSFVVEVFRPTATETVPPLTESTTET